ncbi:hypothetical protein LSTR_LSTR003898 [Laodelphax striatellus]|uniref:Centrosome-associated FAM110 C-terminal domain-containing protein n=1 Tax=Laodelphax striatellus TaxID=195883 RepID=A0A482X9W0_LAOST|nr:hypothetical protein LSTR_LSTR003898 [Laodelphax striatellus]
MATSTVTQTAPSTPLRTINRGSNFKRHGNGSGRSSVSMSGKRKSAVELLQETKSLYVKSNTVLDKKQQLSALTCSSERKSPRHHNQHHCHYHTDKTSGRRDGVLLPTTLPTHPPKSPRLVMSSASLVIPNQAVKSTSDQLQAKLRRLLNADSKENLVDVQDAPLPTNLPPSIPTPTSPQSSIDRMSSVILPPPKNFSESRRSSLASSQSQTSLVRTTKAGTLVSRDRQVDKQSKRRRRSRSGGDRGDYGFDCRRSVSGRFCAEELPNRAAVRIGNDQSEPVERRSWFHKSLPDLSQVALPIKSRECSSSSATSSISSSEDNPSCNYALYSASTNSSRSEKKQRSIGCLPTSRHRVSSGNNNKSSNSNSAMSVCSGHSRRQSARGSWRSLSDEDSASGDKTRDDYDDEEDDDDNIEVRDDEDIDDCAADEDDDNDDEEDDDLNAERDEGFDGDVDLVFGSPVKSSASYIGAASTTVRYSRIRCDTDWSSTAVDGDYKDDNELCGSESLRHWRPILRSKSDVGRRYARLSYASPVDTSPTNPADLETFFQQLGLDAAEYNSLIAGNQSNDSQCSSPVFFSDASTIDSAELCAVANARRAMNKSGEALNEAEANERERENASDLPSVVERNARIIKWLCNCRKAAALSSKSTNDARINQHRHPTMS